MIIIDSLNVEIQNNRLIIDGKTINSITLLDRQSVLRSISISPKHYQTFLNGNLMASDELGIVYVPLDEANTENECIMLSASGILSKMPSLFYGDYVKRKEKVQQEQYQKALTNKTISK